MEGWAPPTVRTFAWRLATDSLPTWQRKHRICLETVSICPVCGVEEEDNYHPFIRCQLARDLYLAMAKVWQLPDLHTILNNGKEWLLHVLSPLNEVGRLMVLLIFWRSWFVRNELVHNKPALSMEASIRFFRSYLDSLVGIKLNTEADPTKGKTCIVYDMPAPARHAHVPKTEGWKTPSSGWLKLNTDGSFESSERAGAGMILRDHRGSINFSACRALFSCRDALEAELCACMEGLSLAIQCTEQPVTMELDSLEAVTLISSADVDRSVYASMVQEIKHLRSLRQTCITHVSRFHNRASDCLARFALSQGRTMTWLGSGPDEVVRIVADECNDSIIK